MTTSRNIPARCQNKFIFQGYLVSSNRYFYLFFGVFGKLIHLLSFKTSQANPDFFQDQQHNDDDTARMIKTGNVNYQEDKIFKEYFDTIKC